MPVGPDEAKAKPLSAAKVSGVGWTFARSSTKIVWALLMSVVWLHLLCNASLNCTKIVLSIACNGFL